MNKLLFFMMITLLQCGTAFAEDLPTTPFTLIGYIQSFKLCDPDYNAAPCNKADPRAAATLKVNGISVIIPANLKIIMPGTYLTAQDILKGPKVRPTARLFRQNNPAWHWKTTIHLAKHSSRLPPKFPVIWQKIPLAKLTISPVWLTSLKGCCKHQRAMFTQ